MNSRSPVSSGVPWREQSGDDDRVVLVDELDTEVGTAGKLHAHRAALLHRAVSVFLFNSEGATLLQRRADGKYHSGGLWSNTCCTHPAPGESPRDAAHRRLKEELGIDCLLEHMFSFVYEADLANGLYEREFDYVFVGRFDGAPTCNSDEVSDWQWSDPHNLLLDVRTRPGEYTVWLSLALDEMWARGMLRPVSED